MSTLFSAHDAVSSGPSVELLLLAGALLVLGVVFFVQKSTTTAVAAAMVLGAFVVGTGALALGGGGEADPSVSITVPENGATVAAERPVTIEARIEGAHLTSDETGDDGDAAHLHVFVDGDLVSMPARATTAVELEPGEHTIAVELTSARHESFEPKIIDEVTVRAE